MSRASHFPGRQLDSIGTSGPRSASLAAKRERRNACALGKDAGKGISGRIAALALLFACMFAVLGASTGFAQDLTEVRVGYLHAKASKARLSLMDVPAENDGVAGAQLAIDDNNTTGRFVGQHYSLIDKTLRADDDVAAAVNALADAGAAVIVTDIDADGVLKAADAAKARGLVVINAGATDDRLREEDCRGNVVHVAPTRSMLADGLAQYLAWKKWRKWLLIVGSHDKDKAFAAALRRSAMRFGAKIVEEREFKDTGGARRTDSGIVEIQRQMPVLTQSAPDYDVLVAADESEVFAGYLPYRTWDARPVAGSAGLVPTTWDAAFDQWGAIQLQSRFGRMFQRFMTPLDMQAWSAARTRRRGGDASEHGRSREAVRLHQEPGVLARGVQGPEAVVARLEPAAAPTHPPVRRTQYGFRVAPRGISASVVGIGYVGRRSSGDQMQNRLACSTRSSRPPFSGEALMSALARTAFSGLWLAVLLLGTNPAFAFLAFVSNEKGNSISVVDTDKMATVATIPTGQRPRGIAVSRDGKFVFVALGDDDTIQIFDAKTFKNVGELPSGADPEQFALDPSGKLLYVANENDAMVTIIDVDKRLALGQVSVGVEPEGMSVSPDSRILVCTSETTSMAHFIDTKSHEVVGNVLLGSRPRFSAYKSDGSELWVTSEVGGELSIIDPSTRKIKTTVRFEIPGLRAETIQPVGINLTKDGKLGFIDLGPANRVAVVDGATHAVLKYLLVGQRVWHGDFTPDEKYLVVANGVSNDVSVIDVASQKVIKSIQVGELPWGVAFAPK